MNNLIQPIVAQATAAPAAGSGDPIQMFVMIGIMLAIFYFLLIRPQQRRDRQRRDMLGQVKTGDKVLFAGGLIGTIANAKDKTLSIKIADGVKVETSRSAINAILDKDTDIEQASLQA
ncbi:MAG: preprotein translocase subunit YajC [Candidatus Omnitrophota bacterium]|jgi:preprotein translocase subunit YajC